MPWPEAVLEHVESLPSIALSMVLARRLFSLIDLTRLKEADTESEVAAFLEGVNTPIGKVASVCVAPEFVRLAAAQMAGFSVRVGTVANFPDGMTSLEEVLIEISRELADGAQEIDVVFPYKRYLAGERQYAATFVESCKAACGDAVVLKVILETGALADHAVIADASFDALSAGADFIKTSTGKVAVGATLEAATTMLLVIKQLQSTLSRQIGLKVAGGIREPIEAARYVALADQVMGKGWVTPRTFRIGASQLASALLKVDGD